MNRFQTRVAMTIILGAPACASSVADKSNPADKSSAPVDVANCSERVAAKFGGCGAPTDLAAQVSRMYCEDSVTEEQLTCFERKNAGILHLPDPSPGRARARHRNSKTKQARRTHRTEPFTGNNPNPRENTPPELTVTARFNTKQIEYSKTTSGNNTVVTWLFQVSQQPSFSRSTPLPVPEMLGTTARIVKPSRGACRPSLSTRAGRSRLGGCR